MIKKDQVRQIPIIPEINRESFYNAMLEEAKKLKDKIEYICNVKIPIACFTIKQDQYLFWHCPLPFIRKYLIEQCGYEEKWYHKILFKFTFKN